MSDEQQDHGLAIPSWIDTDGYSDREREIFLAGVEFDMVYQSILDGKGWDQRIRFENWPRVRIMCAKLEVALTATDKDQGWIHLNIKPEHE